MTTIASGFNDGPGMIEQLRELVDAVPFQPFTIMLVNDVYEISVRTDIKFTHYGSPKVRDHNGWHILNVDHVIRLDVEE
jgi:hypothetical protein